MRLKQHKTCYGCKALCTIQNGGCALGYRVKKKREGEEPNTRLRRTPAEPCPRPTTNRDFMEAAEEYSAA